MSPERLLLNFALCPTLIGTSPAKTKLSRQFSAREKYKPALDKRSNIIRDFCMTGKRNLAIVDLIRTDAPITRKSLCALYATHLAPRRRAKRAKQAGGERQLRQKQRVI
jgi:hypothetical protein